MGNFLVGKDERSLEAVIALSGVLRFDYEPYGTFAVSLVHCSCIDLLNVKCLDLVDQ